MNRRDRIALLVRQRAPYSAASAKASEAVRALGDKLHRAEHLRQEVGRQLPAGPVRTGLEEFSFAQEAADAVRLAGVLARLSRRFDRPRLQIGVLGRARQGKSTLLQRLTGLGDDVIPSGNADHCTGARSVIVNDPDARPPFGVVHFLTLERFMAETVLPYYQFFAGLDPNALPPTPHTLDDFLRSDLRRPALDALVRGGGNPTTKAHRLRQIQEELPKVRDLLGQSARTVSIGEVRRYVAQLDTGNRRQCEYLAVDHVEVHCPYPRADEVGGIGCVDMPGLGDTGLGQEALLIRTMAEDIDLALLTRQPHDLGDHWKPEDIELFHVAEQALGGLLPIGRWMLLLLNRRKTPPNDHTIAVLQNKREEHGILVARTLVADCSDPADVDRAVVDPLLGFLEENLGELDGVYLGNVRGAVETFARQLEARCETARRLIPRPRAGGTGVENELWRKLHKEFYDRLPVTLGRLRGNLREGRGELDAGLRGAIEAALAPIRSRADTSLHPTPEDLADLREQKEGWPGAVQEAMNRLRSGLTHRLLGLDTPLRESFAETKGQVVAAVAAAGVAVGIADPDRPTARLEQLARDAACTRLAEAFRFLGDFRLTYFGFIHHRIRQQLDSLTPDARPLPPVASPAEATEFLRHSLSQAVYQIGKRLTDMLTEPAMARFAMVEEFCDQILRRGGIDEEWERLTDTHREELWPGRFDRARGEAGLYLEWAAAVGGLEQAARDPALRLRAGTA